eukprot:5272344-Amphidinium_carterae.1
MIGMTSVDMEKVYEHEPEKRKVQVVSGKQGASTSAMLLAVAELIAKAKSESVASESGVCVSPHGHWRWRHIRFRVNRRVHKGVQTQLDTRDAEVQSQCTYRRDLATPRFQVLGVTAGS